MTLIGALCQPENLVKKAFYRWCLPANFAIFNTTLFQNTSKRLLLNGEFSRLFSLTAVKKPS